MTRPGRPTRVARRRSAWPPTASRFNAWPKPPSPAGSIRNVVLYHARDCSLCERARAVLDAVGVPYDAVDIGGNAELEARYREWLPVVEIDGVRSFVYYVDEAALRRKLSPTA